jgi:hypothetical protein
MGQAPLHVQKARFVEIAEYGRRHIFRHRLKRYSWLVDLSHFEKPASIAFLKEYRQIDRDLLSNELILYIDNGL